jgi:hypothetical protein
LLEGSLGGRQKKKKDADLEGKDGIFAGIFFFCLLTVFKGDLRVYRGGTGKNFGFEVGSDWGLNFFEFGWWLNGVLGWGFGSVGGWRGAGGLGLGKKFTWWSKLDLEVLLSIFFVFVLKFN